MADPARTRKDHEPAVTPAQRAPADPAQAAKDLVHGYLRGLHASHLLAFGHDSGAFQQLANAEPHGLNAEELADHMGWDRAYTGAFLQAAYALGFLDLASEAGVTPRARYRFAPHMADVLADEDSPHYRGEHARREVLAAADYQRFPDLYRDGKTFPYALHGESFLRSAAAATRGLPEEWMTRVLPGIPDLHRRLEAGAHVLDVGCGAGWALVALAETFPKCRVVGIDAEPNAIEMAKTLIVFRSLGARADARLVRSEAIEYEAEFDVATLFLVLHTIPERNKATALEHVHRALKRDGLLVILDDALPDDPDAFRDPARTDAVVAQWLEGTWGHRYDAPSHVRSLLDEAGFRLLETVDAGRHLVYVAAKR